MGCKHYHGNILLHSGITKNDCYKSTLVQHNCPSSKDGPIYYKHLILFIFTFLKNTSSDQFNIIYLIFVLLSLTNAKLNVCRFLSINVSIIYCIYKSFCL